MAYIGSGSIEFQGTRVELRKRLLISGSIGANTKAFLNGSAQIRLSGGDGGPGAGGAGGTYPGPQIGVAGNNSIFSSITSHGGCGAFARSFFYRTHLMWNRIPLSIREIDGLNEFKTKLCTFIWTFYARLSGRFMHVYLDTN